MCAESILVRNVRRLAKPVEFRSCGGTFKSSEVGTLTAVTPGGLWISVEVFLSSQARVPVLSLTQVKKRYSVTLGDNAGLIESKSGRHADLFRVNNGVFTILLGNRQEGIKTVFGLNKHATVDKVTCAHVLCDRETPITR